jgi:hypothetical protein
VRAILVRVAPHRQRIAGIVEDEIFERLVARGHRLEKLRLEHRVCAPPRAEDPALIVAKQKRRTARTAAEAKDGVTDATNCDRLERSRHVAG